METPLTEEPDELGPEVLGKPEFKPTPEGCLVGAAIWLLSDFLVFGVAVVIISCFVFLVRRWL